MNQGRYVFMQLVDFLPRKNFKWLVKKYEGNKYIKRFKGEKGNRVGGKKEGRKEEKGKKKDPKAYPLGSLLFSAPIGRVFKIRLKFGTFFSRIIGLTN